MDLGSALIAMISAVVVAGIGYATTKLTSSTQKKTAEVEARGPEWHAFLTEVRAENQKTKDELNGKIDRLNLKVKDLEDGLKRISSKYQVSLSYILQWRRKHPRDPLIDALPPEIREDLPAYWPRDEPLEK